MLMLFLPCLCVFLPCPTPSQADYFATKLFQLSKKVANSYEEVSDKLNSLGKPAAAGKKLSLLDSCLVRIDAILTPDTEHFKYPTNLIAQLGLEVSEMEDSLLIAGGYCM